MNDSTGKLNPLLRLAAIAGVQTAVKLHIRRGDDLDAQDTSGATPLILAAGRGKQEVVRLLLEAGANPAIVDRNGMNALAHASLAGCSQSVALLAAAMREPASSDNGPRKPADGTACGMVEPPVVSSLTAGNAQGHAEEVIVHSLPACVGMFADTGTKSDFVFQDEDFPGEICVGEWDAEEVSTPPEGDDSVVVVTKLVHETIGRHKVVDHDEEWGDVDLHLPIRAAPLARDEGTGALADLLLVALREGMVAEDDLVKVCSNADGSRNEEAERLLAMVAGELGASIVEWTGAEAPFQPAPTLEEERLLTEAAEFAEDLASGRNDPFRFYAKDIRGDLLEAGEDIALGREMEEAGRAALSALAAWPEGLSAVFEAAARVARGEAGAESFCVGPEPSSEVESVFLPLGASDDGDDEPELNEDASFFVNAVAAVESARGDARRATEALEEVRLTRGFLMELADKAGQEQAGGDFVEALGRQAKARERMILCNLRLALSIAKKHLWSGMPLDDLVQEANIGLMKAVERYDWRRGFRFSTYATWWIRQQVSRSIADTGRVVRAPVHIQEMARKVLRERETVEARLGRPEIESETARRIGMPLAKTRMLLTMFEDVASLDEVEPDSGLSRADGLIDDTASNPADVAERASLRRTLLGLLDDLDERAREVILLRFGLLDDNAMTLEEVGQHFGVTRERIRQIESKTMRRLSHRNKREILWPFMGDGYAPARAPAPEPAKTDALPEADDEALREEEARVLPEPAVERDAPSFPTPTHKPETPSVAKPISVRGAGRAFPDGEVPMTPGSALADDRTSRIADEARALGLRVEDRRAQGGELRIVAPFASPPNIRAFGRRLLASGFRKIQRDVFAK